MNACTDSMIQGTETGGEPEALRCCQRKLGVEDDPGWGKLLGGHSGLITLVVRETRADLCEARIGQAMGTYLNRLISLPCTPPH